MCMYDKHLSKRRMSQVGQKKTELGVVSINFLNLTLITTVKYPSKYQPNLENLKMYGFIII